MGAFRGAMGGVGAAKGPVLALIWTVALVAGWPANLAGAAATRLNPIAAENQQPGSDGWNLGALVSDDVGNQVKGYASDSSVAPGGTLDFHVTVNPPQTFSIEFYRIGYYQGHGGRLMLATGPISGTSQPPCGIDSATGMVACDWTVAYSLQVPSTGWISGVFVAKLINADGYQNYVPFVLRDDRVADLRYQLAVTSYQAYNNYPNRSFGKSLYEYNSAGGSTVAGTPRAVKVSFDRPYANGGSGLLFEWEHAFIRWAESRSYDLTYVTDIDVHEAGGLLLSDRARYPVRSQRLEGYGRDQRSQPARLTMAGPGRFGEPGHLSCFGDRRRCGAWPAHPLAACQIRAGNIGQAEPRRRAENPARLSRSTW